MQHEMKLREIYFNKVKSGQKIYEIRLNDEKRQILKIGDTILFRKNENLNDTLIAVISDLTIFESFDDMLRNIDLSSIGFESSSPSEVKDQYCKFYSKEDEQKYGVLAIKLKI